LVDFSLEFYILKIALNRKEGDMETRIDSLQGLFIQGNVRDMDFPEPKIDRGLTQKFSLCHRTNVRFSLGLFYTREEWEKRRKKLLKIKMP
jgi:hypothetical protein